MVFEEAGNEIEKGKMIDLTDTPEDVYVLPAEQRFPDDNGTFTCLAVKHPPTRSICHYAAFQRHAPWNRARKDGAIGGGANRVQGLGITAWSDAIEGGGVYAILELENGEWLVTLPMVGTESLAWLAPTGDELNIKVGNLGISPVKGELPVLAWARSDCVYTACDRVWRLALRHYSTANPGRLREEKTYPEIFKYLGWCSWEQYRRNISSELLVDAAKRSEGMYLL